MRALFIGGTGIISSACAELALARGIEVTVLNRGSTSLRLVPVGTRVLRGDINDGAEVARVLDSASWDVVVDFLCFTPDQADARLELFSGRTGQYIFISSASAYQKPPLRVPILESTPSRNPYWQYSRDKIACEDLFVRAYRDLGFPVTIVRPSHTYDQASLPFEGGWTVVERMRQGREVIVDGDGTSLWTLTHNTDFAKGFVPLLGNPQVIGESFHITSQEAPKLGRHLSHRRPRRGHRGAHRACPLGCDRGAGPRVGRLTARRQGAHRRLQQRQDPFGGNRFRLHRAVRARRPGDHRLVRRRRVASPDRGGDERADGRPGPGLPDRLGAGRYRYAT